MEQIIYTQDRFFAELDRDEVLWIYHNPDAVSGDQFVTNVFDSGLLEEVLDGEKEYRTETLGGEIIFDILEDECSQYLTDRGDPLYDIVREKFESTPDAVGCSAATAETLTLLFRARDLIEKYYEEEFSWNADFRDPKHIGIAYTTTPDGKSEIEVFTNITDRQSEMCVNGKRAAVRKSGSLREYVEKQLENLEFSELVDPACWLKDGLSQTKISPKRKTIRFSAYGDTVSTCIMEGRYAYGGLSLSLFELQKDMAEPFADITVNLPDCRTGAYCAFVDTNNFPQAEQIIKTYRLGIPTGRTGCSGFCTYPEYAFDMREVRKYCISREPVKQTGKER